MRVHERGSVVVVEDTPGCLWVFGLWFVAGGALALAARSSSASIARRAPSSTGRPASAREQCAASCDADAANHSD